MDFSEVKNLIDKSMVEYSIPCSDIAIVHNGEIVFRYWNGTSDDEKKIPLKGDELYFLYSATKPITCTAALQLYEKGKASQKARLLYEARDPHFGDLGDPVHLDDSNDAGSPHADQVLGG